MPTWLDRQIEQLESCVEKCLNLCSATRNGTRCTLPSGHSTEPHRFRVELLSASDSEKAETAKADTSTSDREIGHATTNYDDRKGLASKQAAFEKMVTHAYFLSPVFRKAYLLCDVQGLTMSETASILGISLSAVRARLDRARREMQIRMRVGL